MSNKTIGSWVFERSSGYAGYRCQNCVMWVYADKPRICDCLLNLDGKVKVTFVPNKQNNSIRYLIHSAINCFRQIGTFGPLTNTREYSIENSLWKDIFGTKEAAELFLKNGWFLTKELKLSDLGYDACDKAVESKYNPEIDDHEWISRYEL